MNSSEPWVADALCAQIGGDEWFPDQGRPSNDAKRICRACPVTEQCLDYAMRTNQTHGVWGGKSEVERRRIRRAHRIAGRTYIAETVTTIGEIL